MNTTRQEICLLQTDGGSYDLGVEESGCLLVSRELKTPFSGILSDEHMILGAMSLSVIAFYDRLYKSAPNRLKFARSHKSTFS